MGSLKRRIRTNGIDMIARYTCKKTMPKGLSKSERRQFLSFATYCVDRIETFLKDVSNG